jgi:hypothetical protein
LLLKVGCGFRHFCWCLMRDSCGRCVSHCRCSFNRCSESLPSVAIGVRNKRRDKPPPVSLVTVLTQPCHEPWLRGSSRCQRSL